MQWFNLMSLSEARDQFRGVNEGLAELWWFGAEGLDRLGKWKDAMTGRWSDMLRWWSGRGWEDWIISIWLWWHMMWSIVERVEWASLSKVCEEDVLGLGVCKWVDIRFQRAM